MYPDLRDGVRAYPVFIVLGIALGVAIAGLSARRAGLLLRDYVRLQLLLATAGLLGAKLHALLEQRQFVSVAWEATRGYRYPGGIAAVLLALPLGTRILTPGVSALAVGDIFAPSIGFAMAIVRLGCFLNGCCFGHTSQLPWAVSFPSGSPAWAAHVAAGIVTADAPVSLAVHPLQLYFALMSLSVGGFLLWFERRKAYPGQVLVLFVALYSGAQFLLEFLRAEPALHVQLLSLVLALGAASILAIRKAIARREAGIAVAR